MKKLIGTVAVAALLATAAFAELNMGAWVRTVVAPVAGNGEDILSGWSNSWGWGIRNARISFNFASEDEKIGMMYDVFGDGSGGFGSGDYRAAWYKPADWVKFMVGHIDNSYTMRSDLCFGSWNWLRPNNWLFDDEGLTFNLGNADALQVEFFPVEGLQIVGRLAMPADGGFQDAYKMFEQSTFAVGYTIGSVGTIKAAWNGVGGRNRERDRFEVTAEGYKYGYNGTYQYYDKEAKKFNSYDREYTTHFATTAEIGEYLDAGDKRFAALKEANQIYNITKKDDDLTWREQLSKDDSAFYDTWEADSDKLRKYRADLSGESEAAVANRADGWEKYGTGAYDYKEISDEQKYFGDIQAAFDLTAVEKLYITLGVKVPIASSGYKNTFAESTFFAAEDRILAAQKDPEAKDEDKEVKYDDVDVFPLLKAALGASYQILDNLKVSASFATQIYTKYDKDGMTGKHKPDFQFGVGVDVGLTDTLSLMADFRGLIRGDKEVGDLTLEGDPVFSFLVGLGWGFSSNGSLGIGFQGSTGGNGILANTNSGIDPAKGKDNAFCWAVPISFSYWF